MQVDENFFTVGHGLAQPGLLRSIIDSLEQPLAPGEAAVRMAVTSSNNAELMGEAGVLTGAGSLLTSSLRNKFSQFSRRSSRNDSDFNAVMLIPTGIGAELGGHSGDGGAAARLMASCCDTLITHPNVVNGADLNELPDNGLYAEGSLISRLLMGGIGLRKTRANRILVIIDQHQHKKYRDATLNMVSAARATAGYSISDVVLLDKPLRMEAAFNKSGRAAGSIGGMDCIFRILEERRGQYDAVAIASVITVPKQYHAAYFQPDTHIAVNPWGGVEAMLTHSISTAFDVPSAHAPMMSSPEVQNLDLGVVDPRKASEAVSLTYFFSVLKGLHRSPGVVTSPPDASEPGTFTARDLHALVIPDGCIGLPTLAAIEQGIPIVAVRGNRNIMNNDLSSLPIPSGGLHYVDNYLEAAGLLTAMRAGISPDSVYRPLTVTASTRSATDQGNSAPSPNAQPL